MGKHLMRDLDMLKKDILGMGAMVEEATSKAIIALEKRDLELARQVFAGDDAIDMKENEIEDACLKLLALHQPVAGDLRFVVMTLKVNNDLERMGDLASNFAERTLAYLALDPLQVRVRIREMGEAVRRMVRHSLDSLVNLDVVTAREVCREDDSVDQMHRDMFGVIQDHMREHPEHIEQGVAMLSLSRYLERMADLATNIAEDLVFVVEGEVIRHRSHV